MCPQGVCLFSFFVTYLIKPVRTKSETKTLVIHISSAFMERFYYRCIKAVFLQILYVEFSCVIKGLVCMKFIMWLG